MFAARMGGDLWETGERPTKFEVVETAHVSVLPIFWEVVLSDVRQSKVPRRNFLCEIDVFGQDFGQEKRDICHISDFRE